MVKKTVITLYPKQAERLRLPARRGLDSKKLWPEIAHRLSDFVDSDWESKCLYRLPEIAEWEWDNKRRGELVTRCFAQLDYIAFVDQAHRFKNQVKPQLLEIGEMYDLDWHCKMVKQVKKEMKRARLPYSVSRPWPTLTGMRQYQPSPRYNGGRVRIMWWGLECTRFQKAEDYEEALPTDIFDYIIWLQNLESPQTGLSIPADYLYIAESAPSFNFRGKTLGRLLHGTMDHYVRLFIIRPGSQWGIASVWWEKKGERFSLEDRFYIEEAWAGEVAAPQSANAKSLRAATPELMVPGLKHMPATAKAFEDAVIKLPSSKERREAMRLAAKSGCAEALKIAATTYSEEYLQANLWERRRLWDAECWEKTLAIDLAAVYGYHDVLAHTAKHGLLEADRFHATAHSAGFTKVDSVPCCYADLKKEFGK